jgi:hypothetical protein
MAEAWQWGTTEEALKVHVLALADTRPAGKVPAALIHGNTPQNEISPLEGALRVWMGDEADDLYLCGGEEYRNPPGGPVAYRGFTAWKGWLVARGVRAENIRPNNQPGPILHTGTEAQSFIKLAKQMGWGTALIVATPLQITRSLVNNITFIKRFNVDLKVYAVPGPPEPWHELALHSQGQQTLTRLDSVVAEWRRLNSWYNNELDLVSAREVLEYLEWRDRT